MDDRFGAPPGSGWARLAPELLVEDVDTSLRFWCDVLGFAVAYQRPDDLFAYLERPEGAQIMLCQRYGEWETAPLERPNGPRRHAQLYVDELDSVLSTVNRLGLPVHTALREVWRRHGDREGGQREFFVQDPDGYLIMVAQKIAERPLPHPL